MENIMENVVKLADSKIAQIQSNRELLQAGKQAKNLLSKLVEEVGDGDTAGVPYFLKEYIKLAKDLPEPLDFTPQEVRDALTADNVDENIIFAILECYETRNEPAAEKAKLPRDEDGLVALPQGAQLPVNEIKQGRITAWTGDY